MEENVKNTLESNRELELSFQPTTDGPVAVMMLDKDGNFILRLHGKEWIKITKDGKVYNRGKQGYCDIEFLDLFKEWLAVTLSSIKK